MIISPMIAIDEGWVTGFDPDKTLEGAGIDLRLGTVSVIEEGSSGYLGVTERRTPESRISMSEEDFPYDFEIAPLIQLEQPANGQYHHPHPNLLVSKYSLLTTMEEVHLPGNVTALITPRSTLYRSGIALFTGNVAPGYEGRLSFGVMNLGLWPFVIESGARFAHLTFYAVNQDCVEYQGQWQHGRISQPELEEQV